MTDALTSAGWPQDLERPEGPPGLALLLSPGGTPLGAQVQTPAARRSALPKTLLVLADLVAVAAGLGLASRVEPSPGSATLAVLSLPVWLAILANHGVYLARRVQCFGAEARCLLQATALSMAATGLISLLLEREVSRGWILIGFVAASGALLAERAVARAVFAGLRRRGRLSRLVVAVGADPGGCEVVELLTGQAKLGYRVLGFADDLRPVGAMPVEGVAVLGSTEEIPELVRVTGADGVLISTTALEPARLNGLVRTLGDAGIHVELSTPFRDVASERLTVRSLGTRFATLHLDPPGGSHCRAVGKRAFDVVVASVSLVAVSPVLVVAAVAIKLDTRGPVFFRQVRLGRKGQNFRVLKLRSMVVDAERRLEELAGLNEVQWPLFKVRLDPRMTRVGRVIRALSIDELPQLWNVVRGEMSLVGPRPALPGEIHGWSPELHRRLQVRPGITGMWQVSGRANATFDDYVHLDLYYVDNWSLAMDVRILLRTVPSVLLQRGAH